MRVHKKPFAVVSLTLLFLVGLGLLAPQIPLLAGESGYDIVIVAGQSNAVGRGTGPFDDRFASTNIDARIQQLGRIGAENMQVIPIGYVSQGVKYDGLQHWGFGDSEDRRTRMGFALSFARMYVKKQLAPGRTVLIVPAAYGGTTIARWVNDSAELPLYSDMVARTQAALALPGENRLVAFLWSQGEQDVLNNTDPSVYRQKLIELFARLRTDLPQTRPYPIVAGRFVPTWLATSTQKENIEKVILRAVRADLFAGMVSVQGLTSNLDDGVGSDSVHFSAASQVTYGSRFYSAWRALVEPTPYISSAPSEE